VKVRTYLKSIFVGNLGNLAQKLFNEARPTSWGGRRGNLSRGTFRLERWTKFDVGNSPISQYRVTWTFFLRKKRNKNKIKSFSGAVAWRCSLLAWKVKCVKSNLKSNPTLSREHSNNNVHRNSPSTTAAHERPSYHVFHVRVIYRKRNPSTKWREVRHTRDDVTVSQRRKPAMQNGGVRAHRYI